MRKIAVFTALTLFLQGCLGTAISQSRCASYGFDTNSDAYRTCVAEENRARRANYARMYR